MVHTNEDAGKGTRFDRRDRPCPGCESPTKGCSPTPHDPPRRRDELAEALGVPGAALAAVGLGWWDREGCWTFPERDGAGQVVGLLRRYPDGSKKVMGGGGRGLTLPRGFPFPVSGTPGGEETGNGDPDPAGQVFIPEGPSCVAAAVAMALPAVGRPSNTGGT